MTLSAGQFCTKPGLLFVPAGAVSDEEFVDALAAHRSAAPLLNEHIHRSYAERLGPARPSRRPHHRRR